MTIRKERTWCDRCNAPEVHEGMLPDIELFLEARPTWRAVSESNGVTYEGFDRAQVLALMDLRDVPVQERAERWGVLSAMEDVFRLIRASK